jgi:serine-type D-Ala-D-Ala carboxypeptidase (penicillin-binding protein 5/6)
VKKSEYRRFEVKVNAKWIVGIICIMLVMVQFARPIPKMQVKTMIDSTYKVSGATPNIHWPSEGEAALAVDGVGMIGTYGDDTPVPIASVTKVMTAYLTLKKHPLKNSEQGPQLTVTPEDVQLYNQDESLDQSLVPVQVGEVLTERQMLEALLLPSANNIATMLAKWNAGSLSKFVDEMNQTAKQLGMTHTHFEDASGFDPKSESTATDQIKIVEAAMQDATFRDIVKMPQANIPVAGTIYNVDYVLGKNGIVGVKTGSTDQAGGCFVFAADATVNGKPYRIVGAVLGQRGDQPLMHALNESAVLAKDAEDLLTEVTVVPKQKTVVQVNAPWKQSTEGVSAQTASFVGWPGMTIQTHFEPNSIDKQIKEGDTIGTLQLSAGNQHVSIPVHATSNITPPPFLWRLIHG